MCTGLPIKEKFRKVPSPAHMGPSTTGITNTTVQASQPAIQHHIQLTPHWFPPAPNLPSLPHPSH